MSTHVSIRVNGKKAGNLYVDDASELFAKFDPKTFADEVAKKAKEHPGRPDSMVDGFLNVNTNKKVITINGTALWMDWKEIKQKLAKLREEGWDIDINELEEGKVPDLTKDNIEGVIKTLLEMKDKFIIKEDVDATIKAEGKEIAIVAVPGGYQITVLEVGEQLPAPEPATPPAPAEPEKKEEEPIESARTDKGVDEKKKPFSELTVEEKNKLLTALQNRYSKGGIKSFDEADVKEFYETGKLAEYEPKEECVTSEGKVPDVASANQEGIIKDLLEKHGLKEDAAPVTGEQTKHDEQPVVAEAVAEVGKTYKVTKKMDVPYFRWEFPSNLGEMSIGDVAEAAADIETLMPGSPRSVQVLDVTGIDKCKDGEVVLAAQNLSDDGDRYQPSSKHLYIIPMEVFKKSTAVVKAASEENVVSEEEVRESVRIMKGLR